MRILLLAVLFMSSTAIAQSNSLNIGIPNTPQSYQSDKIRAGDVDCQMAIGSSTNVEFGVMGIINQNDPFSNSYSGFEVNPNFDPNGRVKDVGVYAKITIPLGAPKKRIDCTILYELEIERKRLELMKLKQEIYNLKQLQFQE